MAEHNPWYKDGLNFTCTRCSRCCRHDSGYVFLSETDIQKFCEYFNLDRRSFVSKYCVYVNFGVTSRLSLKEQENFDCVFWKDGGCSVYEARPLQCRAYPFWPHNIERREDWQELTEECPGINIGKLHSKEEIQQWLLKRKQEPFTSSR